MTRKSILGSFSVLAVVGLVVGSLLTLRTPHQPLKTNVTSVKTLQPEIIKIGDKMELTPPTNLNYRIVSREKDRVVLELDLDHLLPSDAELEVYPGYSVQQERADPEFMLHNSSGTVQPYKCVQYDRKINPRRNNVLRFSLRFELQPNADQPIQAMHDILEVIVGELAKNDN